MPTRTWVHWSRRSRVGRTCVRHSSWSLGRPIDPMRRRLAQCGTFLAAGAVLTVALAWGSAALLRVNGVQSPANTRWISDPSRPSEFTWEAVSFEGPGASVLIARRLDASRSRADRLAQLPNWADLLRAGAEVQGGVQFDARGWPFRSLVCRFEWRGPGEPDLRCGVGIFESSRTLNALSYRALPVEPIPLGFALDVLFWGTICYLCFLGVKRLLLGVKRLLRARRVRRGVCIRCSYPVAGSLVCPECGTALGR
jgi:hypothetical protein